MSRNLRDAVAYPPDHVDVEVHSIRTLDDGKPLVVRCHRRDQIIDVLERTRAMPGIAPKTAEQKAAEARESEEARRLREAKDSRPYAGPVIEGCCSVLLDGERTDPAFSAGGKVAGTIPLERLNDVDTLTLFQTALNVNGYADPEIARLLFRGDDGPGGGAGPEALADGGEVRDEAASAAGVPDQETAQAAG